MSEWMLEAVPAPWTAAAKPVTARQLTTPTTETCLAARRLIKMAVLFRIHLRLPLAGKLGWSARAAPLHDGKRMQTDRSSIRNERHYLMDKKNDHSCKHGQRDSLIDTRAANHCYAFHSFPIQTKVRVLTCLLSRCTASVNEPLRACASPAVF